MKFFNFLSFKYFRTSGFTKKSEGTVFVCALMCFLFQCHFLSAQKIYEANNNQFGLISLENGATIYSADKDFNKATKHEKIVFNRALVPVSNKNFHTSKKQVGNWIVVGKINFFGKLNNEIPKNSIDQPKLISLINGAKIYSKDKDFNQQIENKKIVFNRALVPVSNNNFNTSRKQIGNWIAENKIDFSGKLNNEIPKNSIDQPKLISLINGAKIYSKDKDFNQQIENKKIVFNRALVPVSNKNFHTSKNQVGNWIIENKINFSEKLNNEIPKNSIDQPRLISLINGAKIYSKDRDFNQQIENNKIIFNSASISEISISDRNYLIIASKIIYPGKFHIFGVQVGNDRENEKIDLLRKVKIEISKYEKKKEEFTADRLECWPSSGHFSNTQRRNTDYINSGTDRKDYSKTIFFKYSYFVKKALNYLCTQNFTHYNNKTLDFCLSEFFSIRPPPIFPSLSFC